MSWQHVRPCPHSARRLTTLAHTTISCAACLTLADTAAAAAVSGTAQHGCTGDYVCSALAEQQKHLAGGKYMLHLAFLAVAHLREAPGAVASGGCLSLGSPNSCLLLRQVNNLEGWFGESHGGALMVCAVLGAPSQTDRIRAMVQITLQDSRGSPPTDEEWARAKECAGLGSKAPAGRVRWCTGCGRVGGTHAVPAVQMCSRCKRVGYCSKVCQVRVIHVCGASVHVLVVVWKQMSIM
jgi:MYND finger